MIGGDFLFRVIKKVSSRISTCKAARFMFHLIVSSSLYIFVLLSLWLHSCEIFVFLDRDIRFLYVWILNTNMKKRLEYLCTYPKRLVSIWYKIKHTEAALFQFKTIFNTHFSGYTIVFFRIAMVYTSFFLRSHLRDSNELIFLIKTSILDHFMCTFEFLVIISIIF